MITDNYIDNNYLNSIVTNLSSDIITLNEKVDCAGIFSTKYDSLFSEQAFCRPRKTDCSHSSFSAGNRS